MRQKGRGPQGRPHRLRGDPGQCAEWTVRCGDFSEQQPLLPQLLKAKSGNTSHPRASCRAVGSRGTKRVPCPQEIAGERGRQVRR